MEDWMSDHTFEVVCFEPEASSELMYIRSGMMKYKVTRQDGEWQCRKVDRLLKGKTSTLTAKPFNQAAATLVDFMNLHV